MKYTPKLDTFGVYFFMAKRQRNYRYQAKCLTAN